MNGFLLTGPNGNTLFLPAAGYRSGNTLSAVGERGYYWSRTLTSYNVWDAADMFQGLMVVCNIPTIAIIGGFAIKALKDYSSQLKQGLTPVFKASNIGLRDDEVDWWK